MTLTHLLRQWPILLTALILGAAVGLIFAKLQTQRYVATMTISSVGPEDASVILGPSISGNSGVLRALRGISGGAGAGADGSGDFSYFIALLHSDRMARRLLDDPMTMRRLFPKEWDLRTRSWHRPSGFVSNIQAVYDQFFYSIKYIPPNVPRVKQRLDDIFNAQLDIETGSYRLSVKNQHCEVARSVLDAIFTTTDRVLKSEKQLRFNENINSLTEQLKLDNIQARNQIVDAIVAQYLRRIAADSQLPIAARILDGPGCSSRPTLPLPIPYALAGALATFMLTLGYLAVAAWRPESLSMPSPAHVNGGL
jgi:uncharacterized protein involved in exopolysaccharide biosynthesis